MNVSCTTGGGWIWRYVAKLRRVVDLVVCEVDLGVCVEDLVVSEEDLVVSVEDLGVSVEDLEVVDLEVKEVVLILED